MEAPGPSSYVIKCQRCDGNGPFEVETDEGTILVSGRARIPTAKHKLMEELTAVDDFDIEVYPLVKFLSVALGVTTGLVFVLAVALAVVTTLWLHAGH